MPTERSDAAELPGFGPAGDGFGVHPEHRCHFGRRQQGFWILVLLGHDLPSQSVTEGDCNRFALFHPAYGCAPDDLSIGSGYAIRRNTGLVASTGKFRAGRHLKPFFASELSIRTL